MEKSDLKIKIVNKSGVRLYLGDLLSSCDSCDIVRDVRFHCSNKSSQPPMLIILNVNDSVQLVDKLLLDKIKLYAIRVDSLDMYCNKGSLNNITKKNGYEFYQEMSI